MSTEYGDFEHSRGKENGTLTVSTQFGELNIWIEAPGVTALGVYNFRVKREDAQRFIGAILAAADSLEPPQT